MPFQDRGDAGRALAERLRDLQDQAPVMLALPRGGVVVGAEAARVMGSPLDVVVVRKLRAPGEPELALGAVAEGGVRVVNDTLLDETGVSSAQLEEMVSAESAQVESELERYRAVRPSIPLRGRTVVVVDDGLTTGATAAAAAKVAAGRGAVRVIVAVPVSSREAVESLAHEVDSVVCLETPPLLLALDEWYQDFADVSIEDVIALLAQAADSNRTQKR